DAAVVFHPQRDSLSSCFIRATLQCLDCPSYGLFFRSAFRYSAAEYANMRRAEPFRYGEPLADSLNLSGLQLRRGLRHAGPNADRVDRDSGMVCQPFERE